MCRGPSTLGRRSRVQARPGTPFTSSAATVRTVRRRSGSHSRACPWVRAAFRVLASRVVPGSRGSMTEAFSASATPSVASAELLSVVRRDRVDRRGGRPEHRLHRRGGLRSRSAEEGVASSSWRRTVVKVTTAPLWPFPMIVFPCHRSLSSTRPGMLATARVPPATSCGPAAAQQQEQLPARLPVGLQALHRPAAAAVPRPVDRTPRSHIRHRERGGALRRASAMTGGAVGNRRSGRCQTERSVSP